MRNLLTFSSTLTVLMATYFGLVAQRADAREDIDMTLEITSEKGGEEAKQDALDQATVEATRRVTEDLLGPDRAQSHWPQIKSKLLKNSPRYILFIKNAPTAPGAAPGKFGVQVRLAPDMLESLLREMGLFAGAGARALILVRTPNGTASGYSWWAETEANTATLAQAKKIYAQINAQFQSHSVTPLDFAAGARGLVPAAYRRADLSRDEQAALARALRADVVVTGKIEVGSGGTRLDFDVQTWQSQSGRALTEYVKGEALPNAEAKVLSSQFDQRNKTIFGDMATKIREASAQGNLNLGVVKIVIEGDLGYREQRELRRQLGEAREIRSVRERLFEPGRLTLEVETTLAATELAGALKRTRPKGEPDFEVGPDNGLVLVAKGLRPR